MPYTLAGDVEIYWESHGQGEPLLLISGVSGGTWSWEESISPWSPHFRVIVFDNMGAGRSTKPDRTYRIEEMANHAAAILDAAGVEQACVVGLSMGGMIAQELALTNPQRVFRLVLGCTHCGGSERIPPAPEVIRRFANNKGLSPEEIVDKNLHLLVTPEFLQSKSELLQRYRERQLKAPWQPDYALQRQLEAIRDFHTCDRLDDIKARTLVLAAERDLLVPPENGRILATGIPAADLEEFPGGHLIYLESAGAFHRTVLRFFKGIEHNSAGS